MQQLWLRSLVAFCVVLSSTCLVAQHSSKDLPLAKLQQLADQGDPSAQNELGVRYRVGDGVEKDMRRSVDLYRLAAKQGYAVAYFNLGAAYYNGDGVPSDPEVGCKWFLLAATAGDSSGKDAYERTRQEISPRKTGICEVLAGDASVDGTELPKDLDHARELYEKGAATGSPDADMRLWKVYLQGIGVPKDPAKAMQWAQRAADRKSPLGFLALGRMYENGVGTAADPKRACEYYKTAAWMNPDALASLAKLSRDGVGTKRDNEKAFVLAFRASKRGSVAGQSLLNEMAATMSKQELQKMLVRAHQNSNVDLPACR